MKNNRISSPVSTGGAGTHFEQHVAAYWLAQLLVRSIPPILIDCVVIEVYFQTRHLGWQTDDFLIECEREGSGIRKLVGQVKRSFTVSAADDECRQVVQDFWLDFRSGDRFNRALDRLALVTLRGTNVLLEHFVGLLDCARAASDGAEFERRLGVEGFVSNKVVRYCNEIQKIVSDVEGRPVTAADIWSFLTVTYVLSIDLHSSTRQAEAHIKSLLSYTVTEEDGISAANASWNALLALASTAMAEAGSLRRDGLPEELQSRHKSVGANEQRILRLLREHTKPILRGIRSTLGQRFQLARAALTQKVLSQLETSQVVLVSGPAGSGKSVIGKEVITSLAHDNFTFGFRAEEFAQPHLDATLREAQIPANGSTVGAILATKGRKIVLVESVERLLEKTTREAFGDLMNLASADSGMCVVLTCRDYSIDQVRASFLQPAGINHAVVTVPPLEDGELAEVEAALPTLAYPLGNSALRRILRNPYFLDKALEISWSQDRPVPESEREFRALFWRDIVCAHHRTHVVIAQCREQVFQEIAVRRARALSAYVSITDLDPEVVAGLKRDALITSPDSHASLAATAHDVLEDWAILRWIEEQSVLTERSLRGLATAIGVHPAIRRSYRKWLSELMDRDPIVADRLFTAAFTETEVSAQFRDDTLVSLLKARSSAEFLTRHEAQLLANYNALLKRVVHLMRVACMTTPAWMGGQASLEWAFNVPDGPSWTTVLGLVHRNIDSFAPGERLLLLGLVEDAARNVSWWAPDIPGAEHVAGIAHWLLRGCDHYAAEKFRKRVLKVVAKIPKEDPVHFEAALRGRMQDGESRDPLAEDLREMIFAGFDGLPAARDLPSVVLSIAADYILVTDERPPRNRFASVSMGVERYFGVKDTRSHGHFPASALRGPWVSLLQFHQSKTIDFYIHVFNHCADWYARPRFRDPLEPAWQIDLTFADGTTRKQWGNPRLWNLYRGLSVGPYVLQSLLMALENWLLDLAEKCPEQVDPLLVDILHRSESAMLVGVVASIATAHPHACGEAILVLLSAPDYMRFDLERTAAEHQTSAMEMLPAFRAENRIYAEERKKADRLSHRRQSLEDATMRLQLGSLAPRVHAILDRHKAGLPPLEQHDDKVRTWRLAMHRMDLRQYAIAEVERSEAPLEDARPETAPSLRIVQFEPEADLKEMVDEASLRRNATDREFGRLNWALKTFRRDCSPPYDPAMWQSLLSDAMSPQPDEDPSELDRLTRGGLGILAAVCIRDHWEEMSAPQRDWCVARACEEVIATANRWNYLERVQRTGMAADRACAWVLSFLLVKQVGEAQRSFIEEAFAAGLIHPIIEVRWHAVWGVANNLAADRALKTRSINALAMDATLIEAEHRKDDETPYMDRQQSDQTAAAAAVRRAFWEPGGIAANAYEKLDVTEWTGADANAQILTILSTDSDDPLAVAAFVRASQTLVRWWDEANNRHLGQGYRERNHDAESALTDCLQSFLMRTSYESATAILEPILDAIDRHPREVHWIVQGLTIIEDSTPNTPHYWRLWQLFANGVRTASWMTRLDNDHQFGSEMLSSIFLTSWWKEHVRHWKSLDGHAHHVHALVEELPPSWHVLDCYVRFLYHIGEQSLPEAFGRIADSLKAGDAQTMLADENTVFPLEVLLQRHVYGKPREMKRDPDIREAVLYLLDTLVENGSAAAFRMRDDFVTPASA